MSASCLLLGVLGARAALGESGHLRGTTPDSHRSTHEFETPGAPMVASEWSAVYTGASYAQAEVRFDFNMSGQRFRISSNRSGSSGHPLYPQAPWFVFDYFFMNTGDSRTFNLTLYPGRLEGMCYPNDLDWKESVKVYGFGWLKAAQLKGNRTVAGEQCMLWTREEPSRYTWSACIGTNGIPRFFSINADAAEVGSSMARQYSMEMTIKSFRLGSESNQDLATSQACMAWPTAKCDNNEVKQERMYRMTNYVLPTPSDQNCNDRNAAVLMTCNNPQYLGKYVAVYDISMSTSYTQYAMCNWIRNIGEYSCLGNMPTERGVGVLFNSGKTLRKGRLGSCSNSDISRARGKWFSTPEQGLCQESQQLGSSGCTWKVSSMRKVNVSCLLNGFAPRCASLNDTGSTFMELEQAGKAFDLALNSCPSENM